MLRVVFTLLVTLAVSGVSSSAQVQTTPRPAAPPPRDARPTKPESGVIKGRVTAADGRPLRRAQIRASAPELREQRVVSTDTEGNYELTELPAGRYTLRVTRSGYVPLSYGQRYPGELNTPVRLGTGETIENINFALPRGSVIAGRIVDEVGDPIAGVSVYAMQLRYFNGRRRLVPIDSMNRTDDTGQYRVVGLTPGEYFIMATTRESWVVVGKNQEKTVMSFATTYYPGTSSVPTAQRIKVGLGQEVAGIDYAMVVGRSAAIDGVALSAGGAALPGARISLTQEVRGPSSTSMMSVGGATAAADGTFKISNVAPGEYKISSRAAETTNTEGATQVVIVDGTDIDGLVLAASTGGTISGQVVVDGDVPLPVPFSRLRVGARSTDGVNTISSPISSTNGAVAEDGKFEFSGIVGTQRLSLSGVPDGWIVKAIDSNGIDLADMDLTMRSGERWDAVRIVLTNRLTTVTGSVSVERDDQAGTGTVVLFRQEPTLWGDASRHVRAVRPSQTGEFEAKGLLPGSYYAIAVEYLADGDWYDPEILQSLVERATRFTVAEGDTRELRLKLTR